MKSRTKYFSLIFYILISLLIVEILYLQNISKQIEEVNKLKTDQINLFAFPNFAVGSNELYIRNRSCASIFDIFPNDGELQSNSKMGFVY
jgi:hypothetical protein